MEGRHMSDGFKPSTYTSSYYEYEKHGTPISVVGRLKRNLSYWKAIGCNPYILNVIEKGYVIPINGEILQADLNNNKSSREEPEFVRSAIDELLQTGAIEEVVSPPLVINPLTVARKGEKLRLVIDLRHIKKQIVGTRCKFEGLETAIQYLRPQGYMSIFDLKSGYHHVEVVKTQHTILGFAYTDYRGKRRFFQYKVLPFGLSTAGQIFTKIIRELIKHWRSSNIQAVVFLDDGLQTNTDITMATQHSMQIKGSLLSSGFIPHRTKSIWLPAQILTWLGFVIDLVQGRIFLTEERLVKTENLIDYILSLELVPVKLLSKISGLLVSMEKSHGELVYLMTKYINLCIAEAPTWYSEELLVPPVTNELKFWRENLRIENGQAISTPIRSNRISYSDASATGSAAIVTGGPNQRDYVVTKFFNQDEKAGSSTERELLGILHGIISFKHLLRDQAVTWHTDCKNLVRIVKRGSTKPYILNLAIALYHVTKQNNILMNVVWIPRKENEQADFFSGVIDYNDWGISTDWYHKICDYCKVSPDFDRFADHDNTKCKKFNSRFYHDKSAGVDAFAHDWSNQVNCQYEGFLLAQA